MPECRLCQESDVELLIDFGHQPVVRHLISTQHQRYPKYGFEVGVCPRCTLIQLLNPVSSESLYKNFTFSSWKNHPHASRLIDVMKSLTGLDQESDLLEIGCNDGGFIRLLNEEGFTKCIGIEPARDAYEAARENDCEVYNEMFPSQDSKIADKLEHFDAVICRQVLEHIVDLNEFLAGIRRYLKDEGTLILEIPDASWHIDYVDYALWEEHVNYFTVETVNTLLMKHGFHLLHYETTLFSGKALILFAQKVKVTDNYFNQKYLPKIREWASNWSFFKISVQEFFHKWESVAVYGCGNRSSTFVNCCELENVSVFIDDQAEKQGLFVPGRNIEISEWDERWREVPILFGVNTENELRVIQRRQLPEGSFFSILPPSRYLPSFWHLMGRKKFQIEN